MIKRNYMAEAASMGTYRLAKLIKVSHPAVIKWVKRGKPPAGRCIAIESATGGKVTRYQLRPDVFGQDPNHAHVNVLQPELTDEAT